MVHSQVFYKEIKVVDLKTIFDAAKNRRLRHSFTEERLPAEFYYVENE
jgi:hypothetical protein